MVKRDKLTGIRRNWDRCRPCSGNRRSRQPVLRHSRNFGCTSCRRVASAATRRPPRSRSRWLCKSWPFYPCAASKGSLWPCIWKTDDTALIIKICHTFKRNSWSSINQILVASSWNTRKFLCLLPGFWEGWYRYVVETMFSDRFYLDYIVSILFIYQRRYRYLERTFLEAFNIRCFWK